MSAPSVTHVSSFKYLVSRIRIQHCLDFFLPCCVAVLFFADFGQCLMRMRVGSAPTEQANKAAEQASGSAEAAPAPEAAAKGASTPPAVDQTEADKAISAAPAQEQAAKSSAPSDKVRALDGAARARPKARVFVPSE